MRDAERSLRGGAPEAAVPPQSQAVDQLQQGLGDMAQQLLERMLGLGGQGGGPQDLGGGTGRVGRDPFGRPLPNMSGLKNSGVTIPDRGEVQRAREILQELRRRAGDAGRPKLELDYIDRLLQQF